MANTLLTIGEITQESLMVLENNLTFTKYVRRTYDDQFAQKDAKIGNTLNIRKPPRYVGRDGQALQLEDAVETFVPLVLTNQSGVDIAFTSQELALSVDDFSERFLKGMIANVANKIDFNGTLQYLNVNNEVGIPGTVPNTLLTYLQAGQRLDEEACPKDNLRACVIGPGMQATIVDALKGLFQDSNKIAEQYDTGNMGKTIGFKFSMDQNIRTQKVGLQGGTPQIVGGGQSGAAILTNGWSNNTQVLNQGDIVTFAGSNAVNPQNKQSTGVLRQWVVTANVQSNGAGAATIPISGPQGNGMILAGPFQNVDASPINGAAITVQGAPSTNSPRGMAFHRDAFAFASCDLPLYGAGVVKDFRVSDDQLGMSIRMIQAYDINQDRCPYRLDVLYGWVTLYPELACRIAS